MKETLAYNVLETMQWRYMQSLNAVEWGMKFGIKFYHYDGIGKRLSDLKKYGLVESKGDDEKGYMLYQVSEKGLCIKSMEEYAQAVYKPRTPKPKKTREESAVKKECKKENKAGSFMPDGKNKLIGGDVFKKECKMIGTEDISSLERWENGGNMGIGGDDSNHSPRSPPVGYTAGTQITTTHRNEQGDIVIGYKVNTQVTEEEHKAKEIREQDERERLHRILGTKPRPRYKRLRSAFAGK